MLKRKFHMRTEIMNKSLTDVNAHLNQYIDYEFQKLVRLNIKSRVSDTIAEQIFIEMLHKLKDDFDDK